jgi:hypothetical protein
MFIFHHSIIPNIHDTLPKSTVFPLELTRRYAVTLDLVAPAVAQDPIRIHLQHRKAQRLQLRP